MLIFVSRVPWACFAMSWVASSTVASIRSWECHCLSLSWGNDKSRVSRHFPGCLRLGITPKWLTWMEWAVDEGTGSTYSIGCTFRYSCTGAGTCMWMAFCMLACAWLSLREWLNPPEWNPLLIYVTKGLCLDTVKFYATAMRELCWLWSP